MVLVAPRSCYHPLAVVTLEKTRAYAQLGSPLRTPLGHCNKSIEVSASDKPL